ncbi:serine/threonine-protein kinase [Pyrus ussuriensis x Pyrus communis]|uniref:non-specific serine/threonine protein kinase n=1 Tax=Pyrus ussuriensis x Pyrus communis TaxID=2448454 RepID=A0A5N5F131_9ROSA|nr:serine/threonine-protein kinase [Pyrus ussuriensis x Pyrus communis]
MSFREEALGFNGYYGVVWGRVQSIRTENVLLRSATFSTREIIFQVEDFTAAFVRHKNLDNLLGYRIERVYRLLVHEYVDNKCLHHLLHECSGLVSPLTRSIRVKIYPRNRKRMISCASHLIQHTNLVAYLHEDIEPKILRRSIISSNVLLDHQWDPKVPDFGLAKLYSPEWGINIMESLGCIAPEYASTGDFTEKSDIYSFGVLVMEIITGRIPTDRSLSMKSMVAGQKIDCVVDPKMPEKPSSEELKRVLLVALRCVDPDSEHRPRLGEVIHMLELRGLLLCDLGTKTNFFSFYLPRRELQQGQVIGSLEKQKCKAAAKSLQEDRVEVKTVILKLRLS